MFGADSHPYEAGEEPAEEWVWREESKDEGWFDGGGITEGAREEVVGENLKGLGDAGGKFATVLDVCKGELGDDARAQNG